MFLLTKYDDEQWIQNFRITNNTLLSLFDITCHGHKESQEQRLKELF
jgi:hypothetical protein